MNKSTQEARNELFKFFMTADLYTSTTGESANMPKCSVDSFWHELQENPNDYLFFCNNSVGGEIKHISNKGSGEISWIPVYEKLFGTLEGIWFELPDGSFNKNAYNQYLETGVVKMSWDCIPDIHKGRQKKIPNKLLFKGV